MPDAPVSRRSFLDTLLFTSLSAAAVTALAPIPFFLRPPPGIRPSRVWVGRYPDLFQMTPAVIFEYGGRCGTALLDGETLRVINLRCTHQGCDVVLNRDKWQFECPCHGAVFARDGSPVKGPNEGPLASIPYRIVDGELEVGE